MAYLMSCNVCKGKVASDAEKCPHCGHLEQFNGTNRDEVKAKPAIKILKEPEHNKVDDDEHICEDWNCSGGCPSGCACVTFFK